MGNRAMREAGLLAVSVVRSHCRVASRDQRGVRVRRDRVVRAVGACSSSGAVVRLGRSTATLRESLEAVRRVAGWGEVRAHGRDPPIGPARLRLYGLLPISGERHE
jgi:hypothetical protein